MAEVDGQQHVSNVFAEYIIETKLQFWQELEEALSVPTKATLEQLDLALRTVIYFCARYYRELILIDRWHCPPRFSADAKALQTDEFLSSQRELDTAVRMLLSSRFYTSHSDRMVNLLMDLVETRQSQDPVDSIPRLYVLLHTLRAHGHEKPHVFKLLRQSRQSAYSSQPKPFIQLLADILNRTQEEAHASGASGTVEGRIGYEATDLLYEILRVKRLDKNELPHFGDVFITHLFEIVEATRDGDEPYNYAVVRLIIALNEQFMVASLTDATSPINGTGQQSGHTYGNSSHGHEHRQHRSHTHPGGTPGSGHNTPKRQGTLPTEASNIVLKILREKLGESKTFGENLIFILNRLNGNSNGSSPEDLCVSLLILKILYLLFSTASTSEYFYTNDLRVLVDVFIRELLDLPEESEGLRHTYLRVLHPLMTNTQLRTYPYKREAIRACLLSLLSDEHIRTVSPTTRRLVERNLKADWCAVLSPPPQDQESIEAEAKLAQRLSTIALQAPSAQHMRDAHGSAPDSPQSPQPNSLLSPPHSGAFAQSSLSVNEVADAEQRRFLPFFRKGRKSSQKERPADLHAVLEHPPHSARPHQHPVHIPSLHSTAPESWHKHSQHDRHLQNPIILSGSASSPHINLVNHSGSQEALPASASSDALPSAPSSASSACFNILGRKSRIPPPRPPKKGTTDALYSVSAPCTPPESAMQSGSEEALGMMTVMPVEGPARPATPEAVLPATIAPVGLKAKFRRAPPPTPSRKRAATATVDTLFAPIPDTPVPMR